MRDHKFRGTVKYNGDYYFSGEWVYGHYFEKYDKHCIMDTTPDEFGNISYNQVGIAPETLGDSTGLKDKGGKEIFEGDILSYVDIYDRDTKKVSVSWDDRCGGHYTNKADRLCNLIHRQTKIAKSQNMVPDYPRIVGNIHENPELMEE